MHINNIAIKLVRANAMLYKFCDYVNPNSTPKSVYFALFECHLKYKYIIWGQNIYNKNDVSTPKKALRAIHFKECMACAL